MNDPTRENSTSGDGEHVVLDHVFFTGEPHPATRFGDELRVTVTVRDEHGDARWRVRWSDLMTNEFQEAFYLPEQALAFVAALVGCVRVDATLAVYDRLPPDETDLTPFHEAFDRFLAATRTDR